MTDSRGAVPHAWPILDSLRGFALAGILLVNVPDLVRLGADVPIHGRVEPEPARQVLNYLVATRFVPIFAFLFGMSLWFVLSSARSRVPVGWHVVARRLALLFVIGLLHALVYPGEILREYAVVGLLVLPLVAKLPARWLLGLGLALTVGSYAVTGGGITSLPGLFLTGAGAAALGLPGAMERGDRRFRWATAVLALAVVPALWWQSGAPGDPRFSNAGGTAGGVMALLYMGLFVLAWTSPLRRALRPLFEPLGRMALSSYVTASLLVVPLGHLLELRHTNSLALPLLITAGVLAVQVLANTLWLRLFRYGPLEWLWRCGTWWRRVALR